MTEAAEQPILSSLNALAERQQRIPQSRRWVIKIGSALLTQDGKGLDVAALGEWAEQMIQLRQQGIEIILVSSGAVAEGMSRMAWAQRPDDLAELQAAAAIGQAGLIQAYEAKFKAHHIHAAQVLLTHDDLHNRRRYLNARSTLQALLRLGAIPIVNENDTVSYEEIRLGDNDTLAALVANLLEADLLVILTDQQGLFDKDPRKYTNARLIDVAYANDPQLLGFAGPSGGHLGRGGMTTKVTAAQRAARSGCATVIASGRESHVLLQLAQQALIGTFLLPDHNRLAAKKQWIANQLTIHGRVFLDSGAVNALSQQGKSLLPIGVIQIEGDFLRGDLIECMTTEGDIIARGLSNYSAQAARQIQGRPSQQIQAILGYKHADALIHRDNLVLI